MSYQNQMSLIKPSLYFIVNSFSSLDRMILSTLVFISAVLSVSAKKLSKIPVPIQAPVITQAPEQIRLTFTADSTATTMGIYWVTSNKTTNDYVATVQYGLTPSTMTQSVTGSNDNYTAFKILSPSIHFATMTGLKPSTFYWYKVGSPVYGWSITYNFTTRPVDGDITSYPVTWIAYGDMGISNSEATAALTAKKIQSGEASFITHAVSFF
jgi:hypothetical protein